MSYDSYKSTEPDNRWDGGSSGGRRAEERFWWQAFHRAHADGKAEEFLADYEGHTLYLIWVEDAKRLLEVEAGESLTLEKDR